MPETVATKTIIQALKTVPPKRLLLIDLVNELTGEDGKINQEMLQDRQKHVNLAAAEANAYSRYTQDALSALKQIDNTHVPGVF